jgi:hypothetical protein
MHAHRQGASDFSSCLGAGLMSADQHLDRTHRHNNSTSIPRRVQYILSLKTKNRRAGLAQRLGICFRACLESFKYQRDKGQHDHLEAGC